MRYTLINARPSPFGRKVAIALLEKGLPFDVRYDVPWAAETCTPQFNPLEQLPILILPSGETIYDSTFILEWLEVMHPEPALLPSEADSRIAAKQRQMLGERLMEMAQSLIFEMHRPDPSKQWVDRQTRKVLGALRELNRQYAGRQLAADAQIDLGDIATGTTMLLLEFAVAAGLSPPLDVLVWRGRHPSLTAFVEAIEGRPSFAATRPQPMAVDLRETLA